VSIGALLCLWRDRFAAARLETPDLDARLLLQDILECSHADMVLRAQDAVTPEQATAMAAFAARRLAHEPVSRILGYRHFWKDRFTVTPATLDPRPDSETLIEAVIAHVDKNAACTILDLGTGTGCLALSLLREFPHATSTGIDLSAEAVQAAERNARDLGLSRRAQFIATDWGAFRTETPFDVVISNPPYIAPAEAAGLAPDVRLYDPPAALFAGADGLEAYRTIVPALPRLLKPDGLIFFEIGQGQKDAVSGVLADGGIHVLRIVPDLAGRDRCIVAHMGGTAGVRI